MPENIKRAKYRVKNAEGVYELVYLETSMDQVEGLDAEFQSVGAEIEAVEAVAAGLNTRLTKAESDITKEISDREAAITGVQGEVSKVASDLAKEVARATGAEKALGDRVTVLEGEIGTDLGDLREAVAGNTSAIAKEVSDREGEITRVEGLVSAEEARAKAAEKVNADAIATKVAQTDFDKEVIRVNGELAKKADKTQVATDIAAAVNVEKERALAAEGVLQTNINKVGSDLSAEVTRAKGEEARIEGLAKVAQEEVDALEVVVSNHVKDNETAISGINGKISAVEGRLNVVEPKVSTLEGKVATHSTEIADLKAAVSDKNSNTLVFATMEEFQGATLSPKVGDLAFVLDVKKAFIFKGDMVQSLELPTPPAGWVYFDEISTEVDLKDYAKSADVNAALDSMEAAYVAADKVVEGKVDKVAGDLVTESNRAKQAEAGLQTGVNTNKTAIEKEVSDRVEAVGALSQKVTNNATVIGSVAPSNGDLGHIWLELK